MIEQNGNKAERLAALRRLAAGRPVADGAVLDRLRRDGLVAGEGSAITGTGRALLRRALSEGEAFRAQHGAVVRTRLPDGEAAAVDLAESPLGWLKRRGALDEAAFAAGERLRRDFTKGQLMPSVTSNWSVVLRTGGRGGAGAGDLADAAVAARGRVAAALAAVGPEFADVLVDVCCFLKGLAEVERGHEWPARSGKVILRLALAALARHYGISAVAQGPTRGHVRHWGAEGFRPGIGGK